MDKIKLLEIIPSLMYGGAERFVYDICRLVDKNKVDLTLLLFYDSENSRYLNELRQEGIKVITLGKKLGLQPSFFHKVSKAILKIKPDVIHTHLTSNLYMMSYYMFHKNVKVYHTVHNIASMEQEGSMKKLMAYLYREKKVVPIGISDYISKTITKEYGLVADDFYTIYNGIDTRKFEAKKVYKSNDIIKFIAVGRFMNQKNYNLMIDAFNKAYQIEPNIHLTILGDGELKESLIEKVDKLDINDHVEFVGNVGNVQDYLVNADCFLMSSDYEGLPLSMLEAMSCGLPVVSTKAGGVIDIVENGVNGYLSNVNDVDGLANNIVKMIKEDKFEQFGKRSYELSKQYDIRDCVDKYLHVFIYGQNELNEGVAK